MLKSSGRVSAEGSSRVTVGSDALQPAQRPLTVAAVAQVGPDDVLLGETEDSQPASSHGGVDDHARVHHHPRALEEAHSAKGEKTSVNQAHGSWEWAVSALPDVAVGRPVLQEPAVGGFVLPADVAGVLPQEFDLVAGIASVPQRVPQVLTRARDRFHSLDGQTEWTS